MTTIMTVIRTPIWALAQRRRNVRWVVCVLGHAHAKGSGESSFMWLRRRDMANPSRTLLLPWQIKATGLPIRSTHLLQDSACRMLEGYQSSPRTKHAQPKEPTLSPAVLSLPSLDHEKEVRMGATQQGTFTTTRN